MFCENYDKLVSNLEGRGFTVHSAAGGDEAKKKLVLDLIGDRASVGRRLDDDQLARASRRSARAGQPRLFPLGRQA